MLLFGGNIRKVGVVIYSGVIVVHWHESKIYCYLETPDHVNRKLFRNCGAIDKRKCAWQVKMSLLKRKNTFRSGDAYLLMCYRRDIFNSNIWYIIINFIYHIHIVYDISQDLHVTSGLTNVYSLQLCYRENLWCEDNNVSGNPPKSRQIVPIVYEEVKSWYIFEISRLVNPSTKPLCTTPFSQFITT